MKNKIHSLFPLVFLIFPGILFSQWSPNGAGTADPIYREGNTGIGLNSAPQAKLHIRTIDDDEVIYPNDPFPVSTPPVLPDLRLQSSYSGLLGSEEYIWDIFSGNTLTFRKVEMNNSNSTIVSFSPNRISFLPSSIAIGNTDERLTFEFGGGPTGAGNALIFGGRYTGSHYFFNYNNSNAGSMIQTNAADGALHFITKPDSGGSGISIASLREYTRISIASEGQVGIGTVTPSQLLTVSAREEPVFRIEQANNGEEDYEWFIDNEGNLGCRGGTDGIGNSLTDILWVKKDGKVCIGTSSSPESLLGGSVYLGAYKLYVKGGIISEESRVRTGWADYVFKDDYTLMPLNEVEAFIVSNKHLPGAPSEKEVENNGLELGDNAVHQQEKIEEIFLYLIEMKKEIEALKIENQALKALIEKE